MTHNAGLIRTLLLPNLVVLIMVSPAIAFAQDGSLALPPPLYQPVPVVDFRDDRLLTEITSHASFSWSLKTLGEDIAEALTFNPLEKAELKLKHAEERQRESYRRSMD